MRFDHEGHGGGALAESPVLSFAIFIVGLAAGIIVVAILEEMDLVRSSLPVVLVAGTVAIAAIVALATRTRRLGVFLVDARSVGPGMTAAAMAAAAVPATLLFGQTGMLYGSGFDGLPVVIGSVGGFMLMAMLLAPYLRKSEAVTVADFLARRLGTATGVLAALVGGGVGLVLLTLQLSAFGTVLSVAGGIDGGTAVLAGAGVVVLVVVLGGMHAVSWTGAVLYTVLACAVVSSAMLLGWRVNGQLFPPFALGSALREISDVEFALLGKKLADGASLKRHAVPYLTSDALNAAGTGIGMMLGLAAMPHVLGRSLASRSPATARAGSAWAMLLVLAVVAMLPALAALGKLEVLRLLAQGKPVSDLPSWIMDAGRLGLVKVCGVGAFDADTVSAACRKVGGHKGLLRLQDLQIDADTFIMVLPALTGLPRMVAGLLTAGLAAAALASSAALALAVAATLSHDVFHRLLDTSAGDGRRLVTARVLLVVAAGGAAAVAVMRPGDAGAVANWVFPIAAATLLPVLMLAVWWRRTNGWGAVAGMLAGGGIVIYYLAATRFAPVAFFETWFGFSNAGMSAVMKYQSLRTALAGAAAADIATTQAALQAQAREIANIWGLKPAAAGLLGLPVTILVCMLVSLVTPRPSAETLARLDVIRRPHRKEAAETGVQRASTAS